MPELENKTAQRTQSLDSEFTVQNDTNSSAKSLPSVPLQLKTNGEKLQNEKEQHSMPTEESFLFASPSTLPPEDSKSAGEKPAQGKFKSTLQLKKGYGAPPLQFKSNPLQLKGVEEEESLQAKLNPLQLKSAEEEEEPLQQKVNPIQKTAGEEEEEPLQKKSDNSNGLPAPVQNQMEGALGADFSNVNIHANSQSATDVGALAYTQGNDVHFAPGQYNPESSSGQELIGHELTHVVQQREGRVQPTTQAKGLPVNDDKGLEDEADAGGRKAVQMKGAGNSKINNLQLKQINIGNISSDLIQKKESETENLPPNVIYNQNSKIWQQISILSEVISQGGKEKLPSVDNEFNLSKDNTNKFIDHAQASHLYFSDRAGTEPSGKSTFKEDISNLGKKLLYGDTNRIKAKYCETDMSFGANFLQELNIGSQNCGSWVSTVNSALDSYTSLVDTCKGMNIEVYNESPKGLKKHLDPNAIGEQKIKIEDIEGEGNTLYTLARKADLRMPDSNEYSKSIIDYNTCRNNLSPKTRALTSMFLAERKNIIDSKIKANEEDKEKWEVYKKIVDTFANGVTLAVSSGLASDVAIETKPLDYKEKGHQIVSFALDNKISHFDKVIATYNKQKGQIDQAIIKQELIEKTEEHRNALDDLRNKAKAMEAAEANFQGKMDTWGKDIDKKLKENKSNVSSPTEGSELVSLFSKIRDCKLKFKLVNLTSGKDVAGMSNTLQNISSNMTDIDNAIDGRQDGRTNFAKIESRRWQMASSSISNINNVMNSRELHIVEIETAFLSTFIKNGGAHADGSKINSSI